MVGVAVVGHAADFEFDAAVVDADVEGIVTVDGRTPS
jgi:hypothetical protein